MAKVASVAEKMEQRVVNTSIPGIETQQVSLSIEGITELIIHNFSKKCQDEIEAKQAGEAKGPGRKKREPENDFDQAHYWIDKAKGISGIKTTMLKAAILKAASVNWKGWGLSKDLVAGAVFVMGDENGLIPILDAKTGKPLKSYMRSDMRRLESGVADPVYRPGYKNWRVNFQIEFVKNQVNLDQIMAMLQYAGYSVGIGDWRPCSKENKNGDHGRFKPISSEARQVRLVMAR